MLAVLQLGARVIRNPLAGWSVAKMLIRGWWLRATYRLTGQRVRIGRNFRVVGRLEIRGPGTVIFGDDCTVVSSKLAPVTPYTNAEDAVIQFGNRVVLNGTRFSCQSRIEIGDDSLLADARLCDSDFHALEPYGKHRWNTTGQAKGVYVGPNVWICAGAMVLKGVTIGADAVVGAGAIVTQSVPPRTVVAGNPARAVRVLRTPKASESVTLTELPWGRNGLSKDTFGSDLEGRASQEQAELLMQS